MLYGNIGAADRLDFTVIGPAVNEVARIETLCEPLGRNVLVSAELAGRRWPGLPSRIARSVQLARCTRGTRNLWPGVWLAGWGTAPNLKSRLLCDI